MIVRLGRVALGWCFERLYHELAWSYDLVSWLVSGGRWRRWQRSALDFVLPDRVLEVGPGTGHLLADLLAAGYDAWGLESSPQMLRRSSRTLSSRGWLGRIVGGDARAMPFRNGSFRSVVLTFPSAYVLSDEFAREVERVLEPGGTAVAVLGAEARTWPWPGVLEWALGVLGSGVKPLSEDRFERDAASIAPWAPFLSAEYRQLNTADGIVLVLVGRKAGP